jgi:hypothetical protein
VVDFVVEEIMEGMGDLFVLQDEGKYPFHHEMIHIQNFCGIYSEVAKAAMVLEYSMIDYENKKMEG